MKSPPVRPSSQPADHTFRSLITVFGMFRRVMDPFFTRHGISASQWGVLLALSKADEEVRNGGGGGATAGIRLTDLSERLLIRPPSVTGVVDRLHRMGLVERTAASDDQRAKQVRLTPTGRRLVRRVLKNHPAQVELVMAGLDASERSELQRLLNRLAEHLSTMVDVGPCNCGAGHGCQSSNGQNKPEASVRP